MQRGPLVLVLLIAAALLAALNLILSIVCLVQLPRHDWLGLFLAVALALPACGWALSLRNLHAGAQLSAVAFLTIWTAWTVNDFWPCAAGTCNTGGFLLVAMTNLVLPWTRFALIFWALLFVAYKLESRRNRQQLSSVQGS